MMYNKVAEKPPYFLEYQMDESANKRVFSFEGHEFPDVRLEECFISELTPSETVNFGAHTDTVLIIVTDGKCTVSGGEKRFTAMRSNGILLDAADTAKIKADSIEPATIIGVRMTGESLKSLVAMIERRGSTLQLEFGSNGKITDCAVDLISECTNSFSSDYGIMLALYELLSSLYKFYTEKRIPTKNIYMTRAVEFIKHNYSKNISVKGIAAMLGIERSYLSRLFKTYKNKSTQNYIIDYRMLEAKRLFEENDMNVSQVCTAVGYTNIYCFSRIFKSRVGVPPKEYMDHCRKRNEKSE